MGDNRFDSLTRHLLDLGGSRRTLLRVAVALALPGLHALVSPAARAAITPLAIAAECPAPAIFSGFGRHRFAQTFTAQHSGMLTLVLVWAHSPDPANTDDYLFEIRKTTRQGKPGKAVLASTQVNDIVRPAPGERTLVNAEFTPGAQVEKGKRYALVIAGLAGAYPSVQSNESPGCSGTLFDDNDLDNTFIKDTDADIVFTAYVTRS
jgi:hypothetical protein